MGCFKAPKPPKVVEDPNLKRQVETAILVDRERRSSDKQARFEEALQLLGGGFGRRSLLRGGRGGAGFAGPTLRSLLVKVPG